MAGLFPHKGLTLGQAEHLANFTAFLDERIQKAKDKVDPPDSPDKELIVGWDSHEIDDFGYVSMNNIDYHSWAIRYSFKNDLYKCLTEVDLQELYEDAFYEDDCILVQSDWCETPAEAVNEIIENIREIFRCLRCHCIVDTDRGSLQSKLCVSCLLNQIMIDKAEADKKFKCANCHLEHFSEPQDYLTLGCGHGNICDSCLNQTKIETCPLCHRQF